MMIIIPVIVAVAAAGTAGAFLYKPPQALAISGVECNPSEQFVQHLHAHLSVFVEGQPQEVPASIGISSSPQCFYWLHTHSTDGIIHIESPRVTIFTIGQFLDIWSQTGSNSQSYFDRISALPAKAYVAENNNEEPREFNGNIRDIELKSQGQIVLVYGSPPATIPSHDFGGLK